MTMSVGLGRIGNDPQATVLTRKALGILSTPGLLVYDDALTIDETGRIVLRLAPNSGMKISEEGLALTPVPIKVGIDSEVDPRSESYDREWNARLTGPAPNYFEAGLAIGSEEFNGIIDGITFVPENAKVCITSKETQLRLRYDARNYMAFRTLQTGFSELFAIGVDDPGFHIITGDSTESGVAGGLRLNYGTTLKRMLRLDANISYGGGGIIGEVSTYSVVLTYGGTIVFDPAKDVVSACPIDAPPTEYGSWSVRIVSATQLELIVLYFGVTGAVAMDWNFSLLQFHA